VPGAEVRLAGLELVILEADTQREGLLLPLLLSGGDGAGIGCQAVAQQ